MLEAPADEALDVVVSLGSLAKDVIRHRHAYDEGLFPRPLDQAPLLREGRVLPRLRLRLRDGSRRRRLRGVRLRLRLGRALRSPRRHRRVRRRSSRRRRRIGRRPAALSGGPLHRLAAGADGGPAFRRGEVDDGPSALGVRLLTGSGRGRQLSDLHLGTLLCSHGETEDALLFRRRVVGPVEHQQPPEALRRIPPKDLEVLGPIALHQNVGVLHAVHQVREHPDHHALEVDHTLHRHPEAVPAPELLEDHISLFPQQLLAVLRRMERELSGWDLSWTLAAPEEAKAKAKEASPSSESCCCQRRWTSRTPPGRR
mmetsp:Transcript_209/g.765  ORF Transcript_209/g.765 Transcript_209/m.765 type:complete len:313 (-) Transcript_209:437-1375(-)